MLIPRRALARRGSRGSAVVAAAALALTVIPGLALSSASTAAPKTASAAAPSSAWSATSARPQASINGHQRQVNPSEFKAYTLDDASFAASLADAPREGTAAAAKGGVLVRVPAPNGRLVDFRVVQSNVLAPELRALHPDFKTYVGKAVDFADSISIQILPGGTHVAVRGAHPSWFVDPAYQNNDSLYLSYFGQTLPAPEKSFAEPELDQGTVEAIQGGNGIGEGPDALVKRRTYRLALLTDPSYAEYVAPGLNTGANEAASDAAVLAAKTLLISRVNDVYGDDLGIELQLIGQTDKLNLNRTAEATGANGPCGADPCFTVANLDPANGCLGSLLTRNRLAVGQLVGAANYDIGHIGLGINGGGVASLGVVGGTNKAQGCTGLPFPIGDFYAIDYVAHEMGHQFAGNHTFNGTQLNCSGGNRNASTSVEPGSGTSVMAYAGICQQDNLQPHSDPYFSERSQTEIGNYVTSALGNVNEVQSVAFTNYDATDSFSLTFPGLSTTSTIARGTTYNATAIGTAIQTVTGGTVTVTPHFSTAAVSGGNPFTDAGFTVTYTGAVAGTDIPNPTVNTVSGTFTSLVNDIAKGGAPTNGGITVTTTTNHNPTTTAPAGKFIPMRTPFALTGSATDSDNDALLYLWEQNDRGASAGTGLVDNVKKNGPLFRVFGKYADVDAVETLMYYSPDENLADGNPTRVFPDMEQVLADNTNAETGTCPAAPVAPAVVPTPVIECYAEFLPAADYVGDGTASNTEPSLNFRLTTRDNKGPSGGTDYADVKIRIDKTAGPFLVTSQATPASYDAASSQTITWAVNGTNKPSLATNVKISMSTDGGLTFPNVLAASTANDGTEPVTIPNVATTQGRIKIEAVGNYFFDVNDAAITIANTDQTEPNTFITSGPADRSHLLARSTAFGFSSNESPVTFVCTLDGAALACPGSSVALNNLAPGTHRFAVAAKDAVGNTDSSPAVTHFTVPVDDAALVVVKGSWKRAGDAGAYLSTVTTVKKKGATLSTQISGARTVSIVVSTKKKYGDVKVKLNGVTIGTVSLKGGTASQQVISLPAFDSPVSGTLTLVTTSKKKVVIDAVVVVTAP